MSEHTAIDSLISLNCFSPILVCCKEYDQHFYLVFLIPNKEQEKNGIWEDPDPAIKSQKMVIKPKTNKYKIH